ncbi:MarR family winged helix-turn-helix transcriptional regulator [Pseudothermotoga thermarum]|uniref:Transcriptional regulator, MarR family n=1 Tax=Pseudothermotoga thermarum DSM 5069 TaxID=688269 RepID=F7YW22_9THEM|nr:MarR family transcriptional regulator [Pseudothermotoga thermarum]AEH50509.1 transcriptional regulator, MarR family [Pseudothermotoga thermarum DSM 5069]
MDVNSREILTSIFDLVLAFSKRMVFNAEAASIGSMELYVLLYLFFKKPKKMSDIASEFAMTKSNITLVIDSLEKKGFVERERSDDDRRVLLVKLTSKGEQICHQIVEQLSKLIQRVISSLPPDDLKVISDGFTRLVNFFKNFSQSDLGGELV